MKKSAFSNLIYSLFFISTFIFGYSCIEKSSIEVKFNDQINLARYEQANAELRAEMKDTIKLIFMGNSITEGWVNTHPSFFTENNFLGRGIGGQTTPQMLSRFRRDVIELKPNAVLINAGTNDVAENTGKYDPDFTLGNIKSMADMARANDIQVILSSVLPAKSFGWNPSIKDAPEKIKALNEKIKAYAEEMNFLYIDYYSELEDGNGALKAHFGDDGVHPNDECYKVMEKIVLSALNYK